jgi:hypothetical protein
VNTLHKGDDDDDDDDDDDMDSTSDNGKTISNNTPDTIILYNCKGTCLLIDIPLVLNRNVIQKES